ncbi:lipopolysaccharide biosynthesis protein [uncultured Eubacterium sp.]|uniref:lipopolysaccharide biosynthesis protein n=1 Tax=uncultured Eubacterium sp. TaxID=165185 RepID=UPI00258313B8|nr:lipopolysaccharide biosynthesis protein [uncultured Eubacterium sp.]
MNNNTLKKNTLGGFIWRFAERCGAQGVQFVVSIILARLLMPEAFGTISLMMVFINILSVFIDSGMGSALIQKKDADDLDFSTVFYFNLFMCSFMYLILFLCAPLIAEFYNNSELTLLVRVIGLSLLFSGVKSIQQAYVFKNMLFKNFFFSTLIGTVISAVVGITVAYKGYGVWALIFQNLTNNVIDMIIIWCLVKWRPKWMFSFERLKGLFSYGWKLLASALLDTGYNQLRALIIGKVYSTADLAYYTKANNFPSIIITNVNSSIDSVLLPSMSSVQDSVESVKGMTRRAMKTSTYVMAPLLMGLAACGKSVISILMTDKWLPSYPFMVIFCITYVFYPVHTANLNAIKALGRSDLFLKLEIIKKVVGITAILITFKISVMAMAYSLLVTSVLSQIINSWPNKKLMDYSYIEQLKDILPGIGLAALMGGCVYCVNFLHLSNWLTLLIQVPLGAVIYIGLSALLKLESFTYVWNMVKPFINKVFKKNSVQN